MASVEWICLREKSCRHRTVDVRQTEVATAVSKRQLRMVQTHQMQNRGMQVMDIHPILNRVHADFIRCSNIGPCDFCVIFSWGRVPDKRPEAAGI